MAEQCVWLYAVRDAGAPFSLEGLHGVDDEPVRTLDADGLSAIVGSVDQRRFDEAGLRRSLNDLDQLAAIARAHHAVIGAVAEAGPVAPSRLATVFSTDDRVQAMLTEHREALTASLRRVDGCSEWGAKVYAERGSEPAPEEAERPTSGANYLRRRQAALATRDDSRRRVVAQVEHVHKRLSTVALEARQHRPQDAALSGDQRSMLLNGAYLVADGDRERFEQAVADIVAAEPELSIELTGPWPPYSFAVVES